MIYGLPFSPFSPPQNPYTLYGEQFISVIFFFLYFQPPLSSLPFSGEEALAILSRLRCCYDCAGSFFDKMKSFSLPGLPAGTLCSPPLPPWTIIKFTLCNLRPFLGNYPLSSFSFFSFRSARFPFFSSIFPHLIHYFNTTRFLSMLDPSDPPSPRPSPTFSPLTLDNCPASGYFIA